VKAQRTLEELAQRHGVSTTVRRFLEVRDNTSAPQRTTFIDLPRPRDEIVEELRKRGVLPSVKG